MLNDRTMILGLIGNKICVLFALACIHTVSFNYVTQCMKTIIKCKINMQLCNTLVF